MVSVLPDAQVSSSLGPEAEATGEAQPRSYWRSNLQIVISVALLILIFGACFLWPLVYRLPPPVGGDVADANLPMFSPGHLLGTDPVGDDLLSRLLYGGRASLEIALAVQVIGLVVGGLLGAVAAYRGGWVGEVITRVFDLLIAFPALVLALVIAGALGPSEFHTIIALSFFAIPGIGRVARAATLRLQEQPFIAAARLSGAKTRHMLARHIAPNIWPQLLTLGLLGMGIIIVAGGALSFLGLGVPPPNPSWGNMIFAGQQTLSAGPRNVLAPSIFLCLTVVAFNLLGDALRTRWNVQ